MTEEELAQQMIDAVENSDPNGIPIIDDYEDKDLYDAAWRIYQAHFEDADPEERERRLRELAEQDNAQAEAELATYEAEQEEIDRLRAEANAEPEPEEEEVVVDGEE